MALPRRNHFRRLVSHLLRWTLATAAVVFATRLFWGWEAAARLGSVRHQFALANAPLDAPEKSSPLPDDQNAALVLTQAIQSLKVEGFEPRSRLDGRVFPFWRGFWPQMDTARMRSLLTANAEALALINKAVTLPEARWPETPSTIGDGFYQSAAFAGNFQLRALLGAAAEVAHNDHEDTLAFVFLRRLLLVARILDDGPDLSSHVAAASMRSEAAIAVERWNPRPQRDARSAALEFLRALIQDSATSTRIAKSFDSETFSYERRTMEAMPNLQGWWLRPLAVDAFARRLALQMQLIPAARATNWQQILSVHMPAPTEPTNLNLIVMALSEPRLEISEVMRIYFRSLSDLRAMSILLAADLYQSDTGAFPSHLQQLIPAYLPAAPVDPFDGSGQPMHYRLDLAGPTVWSVGENGIDDSAAPLTLAPATPGFGRRYSQPDIVYGENWRALLRAAMTP